MIERISGKLTNYIIKNGSIQESDKEIYEYGIASFLAMGCNTLSFLLICYLCDMFLEGIIYGILFILLRIYAGGIHLTSNIKCFIASSGVVIGTLLLLKHISLDNIILIILAIIASFVIWILSPVEAVNKPLDEKELIVYRGRARAILLLELFIMAISLFLDIRIISYIITLVLMEIGIIMIIGRVMNIYLIKKINI